TISGAYTAGSGIGISGSTISNTGISQWTTSGKNIYYIKGNVGIGTKTPVARLNVADTLGTKHHSALQVLAKGDSFTSSTDTGRAIVGRVYGKNTSASSYIGVSGYAVVPGGNTSGYNTGVFGEA